MRWKDRKLRISKEITNRLFLFFFFLIDGYESGRKYIGSNLEKRGRIASCICEKLL